MIVACLGDSITAGSPCWDPDPAVRERIGAALDERGQWEWWAARRYPGVELRNCGVYGERTDEIARRLERASEGADVVVVQGGINDLAQGRSLEDAAADLDRMVRRGRELGLQVLLADVLDWNAGHDRAAEPIARLNGLVQALAVREGVPLLPFHDTLADPARPGVMRDDWVADGDHPSIEGYRRLGELAFRLPARPA